MSKRIPTGKVDTSSPDEPRWYARSIRMPESVWEWLDHQADINRRSANQQLLWFLEQLQRDQAEEP
jgi:hypothetical protein